MSAPEKNRDERLQQLVALMPFAGGLGIVLDAANAAEVRGRLDYAPRLCTAGGLLHGGVLMAFADSVGAICAYLNLPPETRTTTVSSSTSFLRGVGGGTVTATARPLHAGRTMIAVQTELRDGEGRLVAQTTQSQAVLPAG